MRLTRVRDRDKLVLDSPHEFGDVFISFAKHDEGRNHRRCISIGKFGYC